MASQWTSSNRGYISNMLANVSGGGRNGAAEAARIRQQYAAYDPANSSFSWEGLADWAGSKGLRLIDSSFLQTLANYGYTPQEVYQQANAKSSGWGESNWWGESAQKASLLEGLTPKNGFNPAQFRESPNFNKEQQAVSKEGNVLQSKNSSDVVGDFIIPALSIATTAGAFGSGSFLSSLGLSSGNPLIDNALTSALKAGVTGGNPLTAGLTSGITGGLTDIIPDVGNPLIDRTINSAVGGGVGAVVNGGNVGTGLVNGLTSGVINGVGNSIVGAFTPTGNVNDNPIEQSNTITSNNPITDNNPMIPNTGGTNNMDDYEFGVDYENPVYGDPNAYDTWTNTDNTNYDQTGDGGVSTNDLNNAINNGMTESGYDPNNFDPYTISGGNGSTTPPGVTPNSGFWSNLMKGLTTSAGAGAGGGALGNIIKAISGYMSGSKTASSYADLQKALLAAGDVSQRPGAQWALGQAQKYISPTGQADYVNGFTNPIMSSYAQHLPGTVAKSGDLTGAMNRSMTDMGAAISGNYNGFINSLLGATGTTQPNAGIGASGQAGATGINQQQAANNQIGDAVTGVIGGAVNNIFNTPTASGTTYVGP